MPLAADSFPAPQGGDVVAISIGHLGWRTDWALLRAVSERLGDRLVLLLVGEWHDEECGDDPDFAFCREAPNLVWLGRVEDEPPPAWSCPPTSASCRSRSSPSTTPPCPIASSSTPVWAAARSRPISRACERGRRR